MSVGCVEGLLGRKAPAPPLALPAAAAPRGEGAQPVSVEAWGVTWGGLRREHMTRCRGSLPEQVFRSGSDLLGGGTVVRRGEGWVWSLDGHPGASRAALHEVVHCLQTGREPQGPEGRALAASWRLTF